MVPSAFMPADKLTIRSLVARPVDVPLRRPLQTAGGLVKIAPLVLVDLNTEEDVTGLSYVFCYTAIALKPVAELVRNLEDLIRGDAVAPLALDQKLQARFRLLGPQGLTGIAMAAIDMAAWDALAKAANVPLVRLLGGDPRPVPAYQSCGLGIIGAERAAVEARELLDNGFRSLKVRIGYPDLETDLAVVRSVRAAVGNDVLLVADYNQCLSVTEAIRRIRGLEEEQLVWVEEPTRADDYAGHAAIRRAVKTPIQIGENWWGPHDMAKSIAASASDLVMPDASKIGGVSGWLTAASLAHANGLPLSSHLYPEISAHLLAASPTCHWLEYIDWADPILREPARVENGHVLIPDRPGIGLAWDEDAVKRFALS